MCHTTTYPSKVADNILQLSLSNTLKEAFKEWYFTDYTIDYEFPTETCHLCGQKEIRYHFEIKNKITKNTLLVGSNCILKFKISVYEGDKLLNSNLSQKKINNKLKDMKIQSCIKSLEKLLYKESNDILKNALSYYKKNKCLTPKYANIVKWKLDENNIEYRPSFFKVKLNNEKCKRDLKEMPILRVKNIFPLLTSAQKKLAIKLHPRLSNLIDSDCSRSHE